MNNLEIYSNSEVKWGENQDKRLDISEEYMIKNYVKDGYKIIEAGCGSGRISRRIKEMFDVEIDAFDYVEEFITNAKQNALNINFGVADATNLSVYKNDTYDVGIYMQNVLCFIESSEIRRALEEANRVIKENGIFLISVLDYDYRWINKLLTPTLYVLRKIRGEKKKGQEIPWLKLGGKPNYSLFKKNMATVYWFKKTEIESLLREVGFKIIEDNTSIIHSDGSRRYYVCKKDSKYKKS